jgi:hypothetical protein
LINKFRPELKSPIKSIGDVSYGTAKYLRDFHLDEAGRMGTLEKVAGDVESLRKSIRNQASTLDKHSKSLTTLEALAEIHTDMLRELATGQETHSKILGEHSKILGEHSKMLGELATGQETHSTVLREILSLLKKGKD